ncbi:MAG: NAD(P) transhydrogenase subunit alpha [Candidatus Hydrogenedentes bacterium]|nr:NAD(P) transhydrogenase subunit alpha [Candidatus Hydrogenedentota bacterium]
MSTAIILLGISAGVVAAAAGTSTLSLTILLVFTFVLAIFLGFELISKVPSQLHTPLMSGSNAISGITIVGSLLATGLERGGPVVTVLGVIAVAVATVNVVGGYLVTDRMLAMFKSKPGKGKQ